MTTTEIIHPQDFSTSMSDHFRDRWTLGKLRHLIAALDTSTLDKHDRAFLAFDVELVAAPAHPLAGDHSLPPGADVLGQRPAGPATGSPQRVRGVTDGGGGEGQHVLAALVIGDTDSRGAELGQRVDTCLVDRTRLALRSSDAPALVVDEMPVQRVELVGAHLRFHFAHQAFDLRGVRIACRVGKPDFEEPYYAGHITERSNGTWKTTCDRRKKPRL